MNTDDSFDAARLDAFVPSTETDVRAAVFVQSLAPVSNKDRQDRLVSGFETLRERGVLADVDLHVWGNSICTASPLTRVGAGARVVDAIDEFRDFAADSDLSIDPFFQVTDVDTEYSERSFRRLVPPCRAVALYADGELSAVFPCLVDGTVYTPDDLLVYLRRRRATAAERVVVDESV